MNYFDNLPDSSRIWIYNTAGTFTEQEIDLIRRRGAEFLKDWTSHGAAMMAQMDVLHNRFVVLALDESAANASGCGIDKSVHFIKSIGAEINKDLFQRTTVFYKDSGEIKSSPIHEFWAMKKAEIIKDDTIVFDNTIQTLGELRNNWEIPFAKSWHQEMWMR